MKKTPRQKAVHPNRVLSYLRSNGMSQTAAARLCGMPQSHFNLIANGRLDVKLSTAIRIATGLGVTVEDLFGASS